LVSAAGPDPDRGETPAQGDGIGRGRLQRAAPLAALSARTVGEGIAAGLRSRLTGADSTDFHVRTAGRYAELLGHSKGALMKTGQMLSFVPAGPLISTELQSIYQTALARLREDAPPMAPAFARAALERELGPRVDIRGAARELSARITEELDSRLEAANQAEFADIYRGHPFIHVPDVIDELSTARVLTQELVQGKSWSAALTAEQELRDQWAEAMHRFVYGSYDRFCLFNADPHPGNYLFHDDGSVSFLDFGCVKRFAREQVEMMDSILRACWRDDVLGTWRASVEAGFWRTSDPVTAEEVFAYWREDWATLWAQQRFTVTPEYVAGWIARRFLPHGPSANAVRYASVPPEYMLIGRVEIGVASLIARLHAGNYWGAIAAERFGRVAPFTAMGKANHAFFHEREAAHSHA
jgi:predicted unusual protein kinase regulating ubiquinone biosynthesis (AarF/ABC1/UbiB family)